MISLGGSIDIDFGEILDYLAADSKTEHILLYVEGVRNARAFISALRAASRVKPVLVLKAGRHAAASRAVRSQTGALVGTDDVFDAALRRAGVVRVATIGQLFAAAAGLSARIALRGNRLVIITNGDGPGAMAADRAADLAIPLAELSQPTLDALNAALPAHWSHGNPVDSIGDADRVRYHAALTACLADPATDGVLVICVPQAITDPLDAARAVVEVAQGASKPIIACWMGESQVAASRKLFQQARLPTFRTPESAVELFSHLSAYYRNRQLLLQTPAPRAIDAPGDVESARLIIEGALTENREILNEMESKAVLAAFRIPISRTVLARSASEAMLLAEELGLPVALKIASPDITHKSDVGGVRLDLRTLAAVRTAYQELIDSAHAARPDAKIEGVAVEPMAQRPNGRELMVGVVQDPVFGPVITFGAGGTAVEILRDRAVAAAAAERAADSRHGALHAHREAARPVPQSSANRDGGARDDAAARFRDGVRTARTAGTRYQSADCRRERRHRSRRHVSWSAGPTRASTTTVTWRFTPIRRSACTNGICPTGCRLRSGRSVRRMRRSSANS